MLLSQNKLKMIKSVLEAISEQSTCNRAKVAAVVVRDNRIISTGYVGNPSKMPHCTEVGCDIGRDGGCQSTVHAEANAIAFAAKYGISTDNAILCCSMAPCRTCSKLIINSGIRTVYYFKAYRDESGIDLLKKAGVTVIDLS